MAHNFSSTEWLPIVKSQFNFGTCFMKYLTFHFLTVFALEKVSFCDNSGKTYSSYILWVKMFSVLFFCIICLKGII